MANINIKLNENSSLQSAFSNKKFESNEPSPDSVSSFKHLFSQEIKNNSVEIKAENNPLQKNNLAQSNRQKNQAEKDHLEKTYTDQEAVSNQPKSTKSTKSQFAQKRPSAHDEQSNANNLNLMTSNSKTTANKTDVIEPDASLEISVDDVNSVPVLNFQMPSTQMPGTQMPSTQIPSTEAPYTDVNPLVSNTSAQASLQLADNVNVNLLGKSSESAIKNVKDNSALFDLNTTENQFAINSEVDISSNDSIKSGFDDRQDFSKFLSSSLAKVAEMQGKSVNIATDSAINSVVDLSVDVAMSANFVTSGPQLLTQPQGYSPLGNAINTYFGSTGWNQEVSQKVIWMVGGTDQSATLTLNPPDLGPLQVVISVNNDKADTQFISDNPDVRLALEQGVETLREMMRESGIELGKANVSAGNQSQSNGNQPERSYKTNPATLHAVADQSLQSRPIHIKAANGLVDTFA